ncbi:MAG: sugar phosphate isomerase/epimerase [Bryobacterales bacterium]|nr:sugar phosphate isomerase/epimerase [Bryobacterales bacterium]MBV9400619.1 sugar phosphate isomerase/epimerase [Bryobacterales bacterium]
MNRRELLKIGAGVAVATATRAQQTPNNQKTQKIDAYSRHLQWLRSPDEVAEAALEMGYDGLDITVRAYPGHVNPAKVGQELPAFVDAVRKHGLQVVAITTNITDADSPNAEDILRAAASVGITYYWWGTFRYEAGKPVIEQLDTLKPRVAKLAALNEKYKMTAMYHNYAGTQVGSAIWDFLYVLKNFDPKLVGFHYDIGHATNAGGGGTWINNLRAAGPYIAGVSVKDSYLEKGQDGRDWRPHYTPLGQGNVQLGQFVAILNEINFSGPMEIQAEYPNGGAENAQDKITLPREQVLGAMKKDLQVLRAALRQAGLA